MIYTNVDFKRAISFMMAFVIIMLSFSDVALAVINSEVNEDQVVDLTPQKTKLTRVGSYTDFELNNNSLYSSITPEGMYIIDRDNDIIKFTLNITKSDDDINDKYYILIDTDKDNVDINKEVKYDTGLSIEKTNLKIKKLKNNVYYLDTMDIPNGSHNITFSGKLDYRLIPKMEEMYVKLIRSSDLKVMEDLSYALDYNYDLWIESNDSLYQKSRGESNIYYHFRPGQVDEDNKIVPGSEMYSPIPVPKIYFKDDNWLKRDMEELELFFEVPKYTDRYGNERKAQVKYNTKEVITDLSIDLEGLTDRELVNNQRYEDFKAKSRWSETTIDGKDYMKLNVVFDKPVASTSFLRLISVRAYGNILNVYKDNQLYLRFKDIDLDRTPYSYIDQKAKIYLVNDPDNKEVIVAETKTDDGKPLKITFANKEYQFRDYIPDNLLSYNNSPSYTFYEIFNNEIFVNTDFNVYARPQNVGRRVEYDFNNFGKEGLLVTLSGYNTGNLDGVIDGINIKSRSNGHLINFEDDSDIVNAKQISLFNAVNYEGIFNNDIGISTTNLYKKQFNNKIDQIFNYDIVFRDDNDNEIFRKTVTKDDHIKSGNRLVVDIEDEYNKYKPSIILTEVSSKNGYSQKELNELTVLINNLDVVGNKKSYIFETKNIEDIKYSHENDNKVYSIKLLSDSKTNKVDKFSQSYSLVDYYKSKSDNVLGTNLSDNDNLGRKFDYGNPSVTNFYGMRKLLVNSDKVEDFKYVRLFPKNLGLNKGVSSILRFNTSDLFDDYLNVEYVEDYMNTGRAAVVVEGKDKFTPVEAIEFELYHNLRNVYNEVSYKTTDDEDLAFDTYIYFKGIDELDRVNMYLAGNNSIRESGITTINKIDSLGIIDDEKKAINHRKVYMDPIVNEKMSIFKDIDVVDKDKPHNIVASNYIETEADSEIVYTIEVKNNDDTVLKNVDIIDLMPSEADKKDSTSKNGKITSIESNKEGVTVSQLTNNDDIYSKTIDEIAAMTGWGKYGDEKATSLRFKIPELKPRETLKINITVEALASDTKTNIENLLVNDFYGKADSLKWAKSNQVGAKTYIAQDDFGYLRIIKRDQDNNYLEGSRFHIKNLETGKIYGYSPDKESYKKSFKLPIGRYEVYEQTAPDGYVKSDEKITIELDGFTNVVVSQPVILNFINTKQAKLNVIHRVVDYKTKEVIENISDKNYDVLYGDNYKYQAIENNNLVFSGEDSDRVKEGIIEDDFTQLVFEYFKLSNIDIEHIEIDEDGNEIREIEKESVNNLVIGNDYNFTDKKLSESKLIEEELMFVSNTDNVKGVVKDESATIKFYYTSSKATLNVKHVEVDDEGNIVRTIEESSEAYNINDQYSTNKLDDDKLNKEYLEFVSDSGNTSGVIKDKITNVEYRYKKKDAKLIVKHIEVDKDGNEVRVIKENSTDHKYGDKYSTEKLDQKTLDENHLVFKSSTNNTSGVIDKDTVVVEYQYTKKNASLIVRHLEVDEDDNILRVIKEDENNEINFGDEYSTNKLGNEQISWRYLEFVSDSGNTSGVIKENPTIVEYRYIRRKAKLIVNHIEIDKDGNEIGLIKRTEEDGYRIGDGFSTQRLKKDFLEKEGLKYVSGSNIGGVIEEEVTVAVHRYRRTVGNLVVKKVDGKTGLPLEGVEFTITDKDGYSITKTTDKEGLAVFEEIRLDKADYKIRETKTIDGYRLSSEVQKATADDISSGKLFLFKNYKYNDTPDTGTFGKAPYILVATILIVIGFTIKRKDD